jgi:hypothetical protein
MKKKIVSAILCMALIFSSSMVFAASQTVQIKEDKTVKVYIDGVSMKIVNVAIIKDSTLMLSTEFFTSLGVPSKGLSWDTSKKNLTVTMGKTKVKFGIDNATASLNGKKIVLSVKPTTYKGKVYFPADSVAKCFDKKFTFDAADTSTYFIRSNSDFSANQKLYKNILTSMNTISRFKASEDVTFNMGGNGLKLNMTAKSSTSTDFKAKTSLSKVRYKQTTNGQLAEPIVNICIVNNQFCIKPEGGEWQKKDLSDKELADQFDFKALFNSTDVISAASNVTKGTKANEIVLKANLIMGKEIPTLLTGLGVANAKYTQQSMEITIDKTTSLVSKIVLKVAGTTMLQGKSYSISLDYIINYTDINGDFEIEIPAELL